MCALASCHCSRRCLLCALCAQYSFFEYFSFFFFCRQFYIEHNWKISKYQIIRMSFSPILICMRCDRYHIICVSCNIATHNMFCALSWNSFNRMMSAKSYIISCSSFVWLRSLSYRASLCGRRLECECAVDVCVHIAVGWHIFFDGFLPKLRIASWRVLHEKCFLLRKCAVDIFC